MASLLHSLDQSGTPSITATAQLGVQYSVLKLHSWPELSRVPGDLVLDAARVCALLAVRPTGAPLITRLLDIPRERVTPIVELLHRDGHLNGASVDARQAERDDREVIGPTGDTAPARALTLLGRLWQRLSGRKD